MVRRSCAAEAVVNGAPMKVRLSLANPRETSRGLHRLFGRDQMAGPCALEVLALGPDHSHIAIAGQFALDLLLAGEIRDRGWTVFAGRLDAAMMFFEIAVFRGEAVISCSARASLRIPACA